MPLSVEIIKTHETYALYDGAFDFNINAATLWLPIDCKMIEAIGVMAIKNDGAEGVKHISLSLNDTQHIADLLVINNTGLNLVGFKDIMNKVDIPINTKSFIRLAPLSLGKTTISNSTFKVYVQWSR